MSKKILWIILLIVVIALVIVGAIFIKPKDTTQNTSNLPQKGNTEENTTISENIVSNTNSAETLKLEGYQKVELDDGVLYSKTGEVVKADKVIGTNYFDTTINDMWTNPNDYVGKEIEMEGFYLENPPYKFVGRYSENNLCPYCPQGYSYFEFVLDGSIDKQLIQEQDWIKVVGKFSVGNDESTSFTDFYYLDVDTIEIMNERGEEKVVN